MELDLNKLFERRPEFDFKLRTSEPSLSAFFFPHTSTAASAEEQSDMGAHYDPEVAEKLQQLPMFSQALLSPDAAVRLEATQEFRKVWISFHRIRTQMCL